MTGEAGPPLEVGGWTIFAHPLFLSQMAELVDQVEKLKAKDPKTFKKKNATKRLAAIKTIVLEKIPENPGTDEYRQGDTLGAENKHWFRVKFYQQYRLFFRFNSEAKIIILGWVNDDDTKRAYDSKTDAYRVFSSMLKSGHPPTSWDKLLAEAAANGAKLSEIIARD